MPARPIDFKLTAVGKDERAMSVSGYVHQGRVKYLAPAFHKTTTYKGHSCNHLLDPGRELSYRRQIQQT